MSLSKKIETALSSPEATKATLIVAYPQKTFSQIEVRNYVKKSRVLFDENHLFPYSLYLSDLSIVAGFITKLNCDDEYREKFFKKCIELGNDLTIFPL